MPFHNMISNLSTGNSYLLPEGVARQDTLYIRNNHLHVLESTGGRMHKMTIFNMSSRTDEPKCFYFQTETE